MTVEEAKSIIFAYEKLLAHALRVMDLPGGEYVKERTAALKFDGDRPALHWSEHESDYYGDGYLANRSVDFDPAYLLMSEAELTATIDRADAYEKDRRDRLAAAQAIIEKEREEAHDSAEYARLKRKYGA